MVPFATSIGISGSESASMVAVMGLVTAFVRLGVGLIGGRAAATASTLCAVSVVARGVSTIAFPFIRSGTAMWAAMLLAAMLGANALQLPRLVAAYFPLPYLQSVLCSLYMVAGLASAVGPPLVGVIVDWSTKLPSDLDGVEYVVASPHAFSTAGVFFGVLLALSALPVLVLHAAANSGRTIGLLELDLGSDKAVALASGKPDHNRSALTVDSASVGDYADYDDGAEEDTPFLADAA